MAYEIISADDTNGYGIDADDSVVLLQGVTVSNGGSAFTGANDGTMNLAIHGSAIGSGKTILLGSAVNDTSELSVLIGQTGMVQSQFNDAIEINRTGAQVVNHGQIIAFSNAAIEIHGYNSDITNTGLISHFTGQYDSKAAIELRGVDDSTVGLQELTNSGTITGHYKLVSGAYENVFVTNTGTMSTTGYNGIYIYNSTRSNTLTVLNSGLIEARATAISGTHNSDYVSNTGVLRGGVQLGDGNDTVLNSGMIEGSVSFLSGSNTYRGSGDVWGYIHGGSASDSVINHGTITKSLFLGAGSDTYRGTGRVEQTLDGEGGNDTFFVRGDVAEIDGGANYDVLNAWVDIEDVSNVEVINLRGRDNLSLVADGIANTITGNRGANDIDAGGGADYVRGGGGADILRGGDGNDQILGNAGNDEIIGGTGRDVMRGGRGADHFVFEDVADSVTGAQRDVVMDFQRGRDKLDISELADAGFTFLGSSGFTTANRPEVRFSTAGKNLLVHIDTNGDRVIDSQILLRDEAALTASDFLL